MLFPHESPRAGQKELIESFRVAMGERRPMLAHAPTGLGKTAAALSPALEIALERDLIIVFLTSRHTQHQVVLETLRKLRERTGTAVLATSMIGKKWMCGQENVDRMNSGDFAQYCKSLVESDACEFYQNARGKNNLAALKLLGELKRDAPLPSEVVLKRCIDERVCPYELSLMLAEESKVIIADYYYLFHPHIRETFLAKIKKKMEQLIVIVDEGHNLPSRLRDLLTSRLTTAQIKHAIGEAKKHGLDDVISLLVEINDVLLRLAANVKEERLCREDELVKALERVKPYEEIIGELEVAGEIVRKDERASSIGAVAKFLADWRGESGGFARIVSRTDFSTTLSNRCLDPAILTKAVFDQCYTSVIMSGTLAPTQMYADVLGLSGAMAKSFASPFSQKNRLVLIVPKTTTKYSFRSERQFQEIGETCADLAKRIPGCVMIFFPSYAVRDRVEKFFSRKYDRPVFYERPGASKEEKQALLKKFSGEARAGAALLGVAAGSFGEGVDLPGVLKGVIVVGLPLDRPDLETTQLIKYYDKKFGKGWEYGYILPAMTRCIQNAGRCIRTETDRGVIAFVDERYAWPRYSSTFPPDWGTKIALNYEEDIARFFGKLF